jgi:TonB family protein
MIMTRCLIIAALIYPVSLWQFTLNAQSTVFFSPEDERPPFSAAVDAKGVRHSSRDYPKVFAPWVRDCVKTNAPDYPHEDRWGRHQGAGLFRLKLDLKTGVVTNVTLLKSTGFSTLDNSAMAALRKWRWPPGKWREVDIPVRFEISDSLTPAGAIRIPNS